VIRTNEIELRIFRTGACLVGIGAVLTAFFFGFRQGTSFLAGGLLSAANLAVLRHSVNTALLGRSRNSGFRVVASYVLRLVLIPLCLYAMMRFLFLGIIAAIAGFAAFNCGIFIEGVFEAFKNGSKRHA
jgi:hypothetical protein